jgi:hypothetical protein
MALKSLVVALGLVGLATSAPITAEAQAEHMRRVQLYNATVTVDRQVLAAFGCVGQSCVAADFAGSSGRAPSAKPLGGSEADMACISRYNPEAAQFVKQHNGKPPEGAKQDTGISTMLMSGINSLWRPLVQVTGSTEKACPEAMNPKDIANRSKGNIQWHV